MVPLVSVILPVYNQEKYIAETIESVLNQSFKDFEFIIMDDGSKDNSASIIRQYAEKDPRIKAFYEPNSGKSNATNNLVKKAQGKWCAFLVADDVMLPDRLQIQVDFHHKNPEVDASSGACHYINENGRMFGTQRYPGLSTIEEYNQAKHCKTYIMCSFTAMMVSKDKFIISGGLNPQLRACEDFDFFNRFIDLGYILLIIPDIIMKYRIHPSAITVKEPVFVTDFINFTTHCMMLRRAGKPEMSLEEFKAMQDAKPWWEKMNNRRYNFAMIYFRNAGLAFLSKRYIPFMLQITASLALSPNYFVNKVKNQLKKKD